MAPTTGPIRATRLLLGPTSSSALSHSASTSSLVFASPIARSISSRSTISSSSWKLRSDQRRWPVCASQSSNVASRRGFASSPVTAGWIPSFQWAKSSEATATAENRLVPEHAAAPTPGASDLVASSGSTTLAPSSEAVSSSTAVAPVATTPAPAAHESTVTDAIESITAPHADPSAPTFYLPGDAHIFTGTLDLSSLAGAWGPHPIQRLQSMFLHLHESFPLLSSTGLPWYILIPTVTVALRLLLFYFQVRANANAARMAIIQPQMLAGMQKLKQAKARNDMTGAQAAQMETQALMAKHNVNPLKNLMFPLAQASVFMVMFFALRGLAGSGLPSMMTEGFGWVQNLSAPDPYWILPVASTGLTLATLELGVDSTTQVQTTTTKNMKTVFRALLVVSLPFIAYFPAALLLYWVTNNTISLLQSQLLKLPAVRSFFNIPTPPPKAQPGEKGYIKEPSFSEAFKNMQMGAREKWEETKEQTERDKVRRQQFEKAGDAIARAEVYTPRKPQVNKVEEVARTLTEDGSVKGAKGEIRAESLIVDAKEAEKARRVQAARERRQRRK